LAGCVGKKAAVPRDLNDPYVLTIFVADNSISRDQANVYYIVSGNEGQGGQGRFILTFDKFIGGGFPGSA
jgi:hypothetical protein